MPTYPFVCSQHVVTWHWDWTTFSDLQAQKYLNPLRSSDTIGWQNFAIIGSGISSIWCQAMSEPMIHIHDFVNWTLRNKRLWNVIPIQIQIVYIVKIHLKMLSAKQWPFCPGLDVLTHNEISHILSFVQCTVYNATTFYIAIDNKCLIW